MIKPSVQFSGSWMVFSQKLFLTSISNVEFDHTGRKACAVASIAYAFDGRLPATEVVVAIVPLDRHVIMIFLTEVLTLVPVLNKFTFLYSYTAY